MLWEVYPIINLTKTDLSRASDLSKIYPYRSVLNVNLSSLIVLERLSEFIGDPISATHGLESYKLVCYYRVLLHDKLLVVNGRVLRPIGDVQGKSRDVRCACLVIFFSVTK